MKESDGRVRPVYAELDSWLRDLPPAEFAPIAGLRPDAIDRLWREHRSGKHDHRLALWSWLSLGYSLANE